MEKQIYDIAIIFFEKLQINIKELKVTKEQEKIYNIYINSDDSWLLIWYSWKTLESIRRILKTIISSNIEDKISIHIEINDYLKEKESKLFSFIQNKIDYVKKNKIEIKLPEFTSYERKKIHSYVSKLNDKSIYTKSRWLWNDRRLYLWIKKEKISIDLDCLEI